MLVTVITPSNAAIFPEYIIPNIRYLVQDPEVSVRCTYAQCIVQLADTAVRYLEMGQALKAHGTFKLAADANEYDDTHHEVCSCTVPLAMSILMVLDRFHTTLAWQICRIAFRSSFPLSSWTHPAS